jgi:hypothetical protein
MPEPMFNPGFVNVYHWNRGLSFPSHIWYNVPFLLTGTILNLSLLGALLLEKDNTFYEIFQVYALPQLYIIS